MVRLLVIAIEIVLYVPIYLCVWCTGVGVGAQVRGQLGGACSLLPLLDLRA